MFHSYLRKALQLPVCILYLIVFQKYPSPYFHLWYENYAQVTCDPGENVTLKKQISVWKQFYINTVRDYKCILYGWSSTVSELVSFPIVGIKYSTSTTLKRDFIGTVSEGSAPSPPDPRQRTWQRTTGQLMADKKQGRRMATERKGFGPNIVPKDVFPYPIQKHPL